MNNIQKLIRELEAEKSKVTDEWLAYKQVSNKWRMFAAKEKIKTFDLCIQKLMLLLKDESKQPQPPDFANTMLGEVPHVVNVQPEENSKAVEGATPVVRQNEQTKEVCDHHYIPLNNMCQKCCRCDDIIFF